MWRISLPQERDGLLVSSPRLPDLMQLEDGRIIRRHVDHVRSRAAPVTEPENQSGFSAMQGGALPQPVSDAGTVADNDTDAGGNAELEAREEGSAALIINHATHSSCSKCQRNIYCDTHNGRSNTPWATAGST
jgi:hypothetical protein